MARESPEVGGGTVEGGRDILGKGRGWPREEKESEGVLVRGERGRWREAGRRKGSSFRELFDSKEAFRLSWSNM